MVKKTGTCKLCGTYNITFADSHIVPQSFYPDDDLWIVSATDYAKKSPTGEYDQIICQPCEKRFDRWDDHGYKLLLEGIDGKRVLRDPNRLVLEGYDYPRLKLFFLSLLWRLDASERVLGMDVNLGPKHRKALGDRLLNEQHGGWQDYAIYLERLFQRGKDYVNSVIPAKKGRDNAGRNGYCFFVSGYRVHFLCDSRHVNELSPVWCINEKGYTEIPLLPFEGTSEEKALLECSKAEHNLSDRRFTATSTP